jgi:hypothetical protein
LFGEGCFAGSAGSPQENRLVSDTITDDVWRAKERASVFGLMVAGIDFDFPPVSHFSRAGEGGRKRQRNTPKHRGRWVSESASIFGACAAFVLPQTQKISQVQGENART